MSINQIDHLLIIVIAVVYPVYGTIFWYRRDRLRLEAGKTNALIHFYRNSIIELWLLTLVVLAWWFWEKRTLAEIGMGLPDGWAFWIGMAVFAAVAVFLGLQINTIRSSAEARVKLQKQLTGNIALIVPRNDIERKFAIYTSLTAGICEEVLYRGYLMWYLMKWLPGYGAVGVSALIFGLAHNYQGVAGVVRAILAGTIFGFAYLLTGTLWVPIALHATIDITSLLSISIALTVKESVKENREND
jgi:membrane protease YdiL (CAAX protease family)